MDGSIVFIRQARQKPHPNGTSIGSAVFAGLITATDLQTMLLDQQQIDHI